MPASKKPDGKLVILAEPRWFHSGFSAIHWSHENPPARNGGVNTVKTWRHRHRGETRRAVEVRPCQIPGKPQEDESAMGVRRTPDVVEGEA